MSLTVQSPSIRDGKKWYFLSVFYAREQWAELIIYIMNFYRTHTGLFSSYLFSFSREYGEHLKVTFASFDVDKDYSKEIENYFQEFVNKIPSESAIEFPYGKVLWCNYPNNSLSWNKFSLPVYSDQYIAFHQQTMRVALKLMEDDFSEETIFSVGLYLITKALGCVDSNEQKNTLVNILYEASIDNSYDRDLIKKTFYEIDNSEVYEAIESYCNENPNEYLPELHNWLNQIKDMLKTVNFNVLCHFICKGLGLTGVSHIIIVELLYKNFHK